MYPGQRFFCLFFYFACMPVSPLRRARPASRAARICLVTEASAEEKATVLPTSHSLRYGATCAVKLLELCGKTHFELRSPFRQVAANLITMQLHSAVQLPAPRACRRRRGQKGQYRMRDSFFEKLIAATAINNWARCQFRHNSRRPSVSASTRLSAPAARGSGCGHWHRRVPMLCLQICGNLSERRA